jgi:hypothetical protein
MLGTNRYQDWLADRTFAWEGRSEEDMKAHAAAMPDRYQEGFYAGFQGRRIVDDWGGYPTRYAAGWDAGIAIWLRANSYWGA